MQKNLTGGALINYGTALPTAAEAFDGALFYKSTGTDKGLYIFSFNQDADLNVVGDQVVQSWNLVVGTNYVKTTGDTMTGALILNNENSGSSFDTGENFLIISNNSMGYGGIAFRKGGSGVNAQVLEGGLTQGNGRLIFSTSNAGVIAERMRINENGVVSIGTTTANRPLTVAGGIRTIAGPIEVDTGQITTNAPTNPLTLGVNSSEKMRIDNAGNIGVGRTPASNVRLDILGSNNVTSYGGNAELRVSSNNQTATTVYSWNQIAASGGDFLIGTAGLERMRLTSTGYLQMANGSAITFNSGDPSLNGITGTASPTDTFVVDTNKVMHHYGLTWKALTELGGSTAALLSGYSGIRMYTQGTERFRLEQGGSIRINTTGSGGGVNIGGTDQVLRLIHNNAYISFLNSGNSTRTGYLQLNATASSMLMLEVPQDFVIGTNGVERIRIGSTGNVGVGPPGNQAIINDFLTRSIASTGYQKLPNGIILQWGSTGTLSTDSTGNTVSFPIAFPTICLHVSVNGVANLGTDATSVKVYGQAHSYSLSGFTITNDANASSFTWFAIGF